MSSGGSLRFSNSCHEHLLEKKFRQFIWCAYVSERVRKWVCECMHEYYSVCMYGFALRDRVVVWIESFTFRFEVIYFAWKSKFRATAKTNRSKPFHVLFCGLPNDASNPISLSLIFIFILSLSFCIDNRKYYVYDNCVLRSSCDFTC